MAPGQVASCTRDDAQSVYLAVSEGRTGGRGWGTEAIQVENEWINPPVWASGPSQERGASPIQVGATLSDGNTGGQGNRRGAPWPGSPTVTCSLKGTWGR